MNMQETGSRIAALRKRLDMTQLELADKMGVSYQAVSSWERGLTMPDIAKLQDLSQALGASIEDLLGEGRSAEIVKTVLAQKDGAGFDGNAPRVEEIREVAHILKPSQVEALAEKAEPADLAMLAGLAPFLGAETLEHLAGKAEGARDIGSLVALAPFLGSECLDRLALRIAEEEGGSARTGALAGLAPFLGAETLEHLAGKAEGARDIGSLVSLAPFLGSEYLDRLALRIAEEEGGSARTGALAGLAPFIGAETLEKLVEKAGGERDIGSLLALAPFVSKEFLDKLMRNT